MTDMGIVARTAGGPEVLEWTVLDTPAPGPGEARVAQKAIGVNFIDTYYRSGSYPWPSTPLIPGAEAAGVIDAIGPGVRDLAVGDRVAYVMQVGAYRTRRVVPAERLVKLPDAIDFDVAASVMLKGLTAQFLLTSCYPIKAGDTVLVHAAAGGVGLLVGQWLRASVPSPSAQSARPRSRASRSRTATPMFSTTPAAILRARRRSSRPRDATWFTTRWARTRGAIRSRFCTRAGCS